MVNEGNSGTVRVEIGDVEGVREGVGETGVREGFGVGVGDEVAVII